MVKLSDCEIDYPAGNFYICANLVCDSNVGGGLLQILCKVNKNWTRSDSHYLSVKPGIYNSLLIFFIDVKTLKLIEIPPQTQSTVSTISLHIRKQGI